MTFSIDKTVLLRASFKPYDILSDYDVIYYKFKTSVHLTGIFNFVTATNVPAIFLYTLVIINKGYCKIRYLIQILLYR